MNRFRKCILSTDLVFADHRCDSSGYETEFKLIMDLHPGEKMNIRELEKYGPSVWFWDVKDQLKQHVYRRSMEAFAAGDAARDDITSPKELEQRVSDLRAKFIDCLGGLPSSDTPLNPVVTGTIACDGFRIEKIIFESRPQNYVTANLYVPDGIVSPTGAVMFLCGHHEYAKHAPVYQSVCQHLVKAGLVVLAQDPVGQGERLSYCQPSTGEPAIGPCITEHDYAGAQCLMVGDCLARYFVHDAMRGIDYLISRPEVDPERIGVTGSSGGGTQTCLMMVCDPRIAAAAPGTFVMNRESYIHTGQAQDAEQIWPGMSALGFDHEDFLLMMCPKPVMVLAAKWDFFPCEGTRRTVQRCTRFWDMFDCADNLQFVEDDSVHKYTDKLAASAARFFAKHLLEKKLDDADDITTDPLDPHMLWCTASGQIRVDKADARFVWEETVDRLQQIESKRESLDINSRWDAARNWLREQVFNNRTHVEPNLRLYTSESCYDLSVQCGLWWSQKGLMNHAILFRKTEFAEKELPVSLAVWNGGSNCLASHMDWIRSTCDSGRAVMVLDLTGMGSMSPNPLNSNDPLDFYGTIHKLACDLIWLGDSLAALRIFDVLRVLDVITEWPGITSDELECYAYGTYGTYCRLASLLDSRMSQMRVVSGLESYNSLVRGQYYNSDDIYSILIPDILQFLKLPEFSPVLTEP